MMMKTMIKVMMIMMIMGFMIDNDEKMMVIDDND